MLDGNAQITHLLEVVFQFASNTVSPSDGLRKHLSNRFLIWDPSAR